MAASGPSRRSAMRWSNVQAAFDEGAVPSRSCRSRYSRSAAEKRSLDHLLSANTRRCSPLGVAPSWREARRNRRASASNCAAAAMSATCRTYEEASANYCVRATRLLPDSCGDVSLPAQYIEHRIAASGGRAHERSMKHFPTSQDASMNRTVAADSVRRYCAELLS